MAYLRGASGHCVPVLVPLLAEYLSPQQEMSMRSCIRVGCESPVEFGIEFYRETHGRLMLLATLDGPNPGVCKNHRGWAEQTYREWDTGHNLDFARIQFVALPEVSND